MDDATAIWFFQVEPSGCWRILDYYEASGEGLAHYAGVLAAKARPAASVPETHEGGIAGRGFVYGTHIAPHDIRVRELGTGQSRWESAARLGIRFTMALTLRASSAWPEALDTLNVDHLLDTYAESLGLPVSLTRSPEERQQLRAARAETAQSQALAEAVDKGADVVQRLAQSPLSGPDGARGSVLDGIVRLLRQAVPGAAPRPVAPPPAPGGEHS